MHTIPLRVAPAPVLATCLVLLLAGLAPPLGAQDQKLVYYSFDRPIPVEIVPDRVGLVVDPASGDPGTQQERFGPLGIDVLEAYPGGILVAAAPGLGRGETFPELEKELRNRLDRFDDLQVLRLGLVVRPLDSNGPPMVLGDDIVVQLQRGAERQDLAALTEELGARIVMDNPFEENQFLVRLDDGPGARVLELARQLHESEIVAWAHPNFSRPVVDRQLDPNDRLYPLQWHLDNTGQGGGTVDADIDADRAFDLELGEAGTVIAVVDSGFDADHDDLVPNLWTNPGETPANGVDDDGNGFVDDVNGWDFTGCTVASPGCGDADVTGGNHGTSVAGAAAARGDNTRGVSGSCPRCGLMLIRRGGSDFAQGLALGYARQMGAEICTNSWGYAIATPCATNVCTAIGDAVTAGQVVLFAMNSTGSGYFEDCQGAAPDISSLPGVLAVSASNNRDQRTPAGYGDCTDLLSPTDSLGTTLGTRWPVTTDRLGGAGYNNTSTTPLCPSIEPGPPPADARDYTLCFGGTSFSAPVVAGAAGLVLSARPATTRLQVQRLLQDTADKIEDSAAAYETTTGFSRPAVAPVPGGTVGSTHGWGRLNAFEAVRVVAPTADGGRGGVDVFLRDNPLDWGNTEQPSNVLQEPVRDFIAHWRSVDIKVDAPPYQPAPTTSAAFDALVDEDPRADGTMNRVYVRVRNRGPVTATSVTVKLHWAFAGTALPALPADFWTAFPGDSADTSRWHPLGTRPADDLVYSGASVAGCPGRTTPACAGATDQARILQFDFPGPTLDLAVANPRHYCLLAIVDSPQDPVSPASTGSLVPDWITPRDNNVTHRNVRLADSSRSGRFSDRFFVRNPTSEPSSFVLRLRAPRGWEVEMEPFAADQPFSLGPGEEVLASLRVTPPAEGLHGRVEVNQESVEGPLTVAGGLVFDFAPRRETAVEAGRPDLVVALDGPRRARPGQDLGDRLKVVVENRGDATAPGTLDGDGWMVDLVLSRDDELPVRFATFSPGFREDGLLRGGRISRTTRLAPGERRVVSEGGMTLPADIPPGTYCLGAVVDPGAAVAESDETNNTACHRLRIE